jgi:CheY-like chemotaxis protein
MVAKKQFHRKTVVAMEHVLVIDDGWKVLSLASGILEAHGHLASTARTVAGDEILRSNRIDLVVTTIVMPGQEGMATIRNDPVYEPNDTNSRHVGQPTVRRLPRTPCWLEPAARSRNRLPPMA